MEKEIVFKDNGNSVSFQTGRIGDISIKGTIEFDLSTHDDKFYYFVDFSIEFKNFESNYIDVGEYNTLEEAKAAIPNLIFELLKDLFKASYQAMNELFPNYIIV